MTQHKFKCLIAVKAGKRNAANTFWKNNIDRVGGDKTFTQGLTPNGAPTWYWCSSVLQEWQLRKIAQVADANPNDVRIFIWVYRNGLKQTLTDKVGGRNYITILDNSKSPQELLNEFGLKIVSVNT